MVIMGWEMRGDLKLSYHRMNGRGELNRSHDSNFSKIRMIKREEIISNTGNKVSDIELNLNKDIENLMKESGDG